MPYAYNQYNDDEPDIEKCFKIKNNLNTSENELATEKKITRPSDDPIVAIRALSLRSSLSEINQYLKHNIPDAESWLDVTHSSLNNMDGILSDIFQYCNQGSSDQFTTNDRSAIIDVLKQYRRQFIPRLMQIMREDIALRVIRQIHLYIPYINGIR